MSDGGRLAGTSLKTAGASTIAERNTAAQLSANVNEKEARAEQEIHEEIIERCVPGRVGSWASKEKADDATHDELQEGNSVRELCALHTEVGQHVDVVRAKLRDVLRAAATAQRNENEALERASAAAAQQERRRAQVRLLEEAKAARSVPKAESEEGASTRREKIRCPGDGRTD